MTQQPGGFNPYGAVDLAALAKQREAQERAEAAAASPDGAVVSPTAVVEVTDLNFETEVVARSATVPVVLDFWATWCEPCKQLTPILERFVEADAGSWVLAAIDVDANPQLAAAAQVQSVPTVMVVWQGQVIPGFSGALPEAAVRDFLDQVIALAGPVPTAAAEDLPEDELVDPELDAADAAFAADDLDGAASAYQQVLASRPGDIEATQGLARVDLMRRTKGVDVEQTLKLAAASPDSVQPQLLAADLELLGGAVERAFDRLIGLVSRTSGDERKQATDHLLSLLDLVGNEDPSVLDARRRLANALF